MQYVELQKIAEVFNGKTPSKEEQRNQGFPVLKIKNVSENGIFRGTYTSFIDEELAQKFSKKFLMQNDILILNAAHNSDYVGSKNCFVTQEMAGSLPTGEWLIIRGNVSVVFPKYLYFYINAPQLKKEIKNIVKGIHLYPKDLKRIRVPVPSLEDQKLIVSILDQADALRQKRKTAMKLMDEYVRSVFMEMFGDPVANPKGWKTKTIEEFAKDEKHSIKRGPFGGSLKKEIFVDDGYLVYEQFHALNNDFSMARYFINEAKFHELKAFEVKEGDIIISCSGVYLGKLAIVPPGSKKGIINQALLKVSLDENIMTNILFTYIFTNQNFKNKFFGNKIGSGIPNFPPMSQFKKFEFICPPIDKQIEFQRLIGDAKKLSESMKTQSEELDNQFNVLAQQAFAGTLQELYQS